MNCIDCKELLVEYIEGFLDESRKQAVSEHLKSCPSCKDVFDGFTGIHERLVSNNNKVQNRSIENNVIDRIVRERNVKLKTSAQNAFASKLRIKIMKSTFVKLAAAAVIIIAVLAGIHFTGNPFGVTTTFAEVISPLLNARTASFDMIIGTQVIHDEVMNSRIHRTIKGINNSMIIDLEQKKMLTLDSESKTAIYVDLGGLKGVQNYLESLRDVVIKMKDEPGVKFENKGLQRYDDKDYLVFIAEGENHTITIWADPETILPVRLEDKTPNMKILCDNMKFDIILDDSLFSLEIPDGYKTQNMGIDFAKNSESDFIESLRIWAHVIENDFFPDSIDLNDIVKTGTKLGLGMKRLGLSEQESLEIANKWGQGLVFIRFFNGQGQWHYAGQGIKLGDADTPVFWYQPKDSKTWRVIFGDLSVKEVTEDNLPKLSDWQVKYQAAIRQWAEIAFTGTEADKWHITSPNEIVAYSDIKLTKIAQDANVMYIKLPYASAVLDNVTINDKQVTFKKIINDCYELFMPIPELQEGTTTLECVWTLPLVTLKTEDGGYRTKLQGLLPVESFEFSSVLEPGCGFKHSLDASKNQVNYFKTSSFFSLSESGSCGFQMVKIE